ncbi:MAG: FAD-dependent oxidoreductase [Rubripirellula sp.]
MSNERHHEVIIIGGGLAGLSCAVQLANSGVHSAIFEATDRVGGRVRSDVINGFTLDVGFQVLLTAYPSCQELLDYSALRLRYFAPGALIRHSGRFSELADPWRNPGKAWATVTNPVGSVADKLRIWRLRSQTCRGSLAELYERPHQTTEQYLRDFGFSERMMDEFFRPFIGGVFLDESLSVSSRMLEFVFRMFSMGGIAIPADGMAAIPRQLAERLPRGSINLQSSVVRLEGNRVVLANGDTFTGDHIVIATESNAAARLLELPEIQTSWNETSTLYYSSPQCQEKHKSLILRGDESGPIQTATIISNVAEEYAPPNCSLISVSLSPNHKKSRDENEQLAKDQLRKWFGDQVSHWELLQTYQIPYGLPAMDIDPVIRSPELEKRQNTYICGDHCETPSIEGAMNSGMRAAAAILARQTSI